MPLSPRDRLLREAARPRILTLWRALQPLKTIVNFMSTGAHPDDETTAMLAVLGLRDGLQLSYACSTRGEGGQNDIGPEVSNDLGTLRTAEMERAADVLDMHLYWFARDTADPIHDFGFSKSGVETLHKWGRDRTLARFVEIVRTERPDVICPTFLDVPGQHGHHRAMTEAAHLVIGAAADPGFANCDLPVWQVSKLYLPAWSGGGGTYDDEVPPPSTTLTIEGKGDEPVSGWSWEHVAQHSRWYHATQGMGQWIAPDAERDWPLHLASSSVKGPDRAVTSGLPLRMGELGLPGLAKADGEIDAALAAFPDTKAIVGHAGRALEHLRAALPRIGDSDRHRLIRKEMQLARVIRIAARVEVTARLDRDRLRPGELSTLTTEQRSGEATVSIEPVLPDDWQRDGDHIGPRADAAPSNPYPAEWHPDAPALPAVRVIVDAGGIRSATLQPFETSPLVLPSNSLRFDPDVVVVNTRAAPARVALHLSEIFPARGRANAKVPDGWKAEANASGLDLIPPADLASGHYDIPLQLDGKPAQSFRLIEHPHVEARLRAAPAVLRLRAVPVDLSDARVACIGGGSDRVAHWLAAVGHEVTAPDDAVLASKDFLAGYDTLVVGPFAMRTRPALRAAVPHLHSWVRAGGHLVTLYHRPRDAWDPKTVPLLPLTIGTPSLRWRVTDENAPVTILIPGHKLFTGPNVIGPDDWQGWHKERGLYFASKWDPAYKALIELADPGEAPHRGALLSGEIGKGRHTHCALILHYQLEKLTPGAFRLLANLAAPAH